MTLHDVLTHNHGYNDYLTIFVDGAFILAEDDNEYYCRLNYSVDEEMRLLKDYLYREVDNVSATTYYNYEDYNDFSVLSISLI